MSNAKDIRKQIKNIMVQEMPAILTQEAALEIQKALKAHLDSRLDAIAKHLKDTLDNIDQRSKDIQAYTLRQK